MEFTALPSLILKSSSTSLLAPQSGDHRRDAFRGFPSNPVPLIAVEHLSLYNIQVYSVYTEAFNLVSAVAVCGKVDHGGLNASRGV